MATLIDNRYQYIRNADGTEELYEYRISDLEEHNLATDSEGLVPLQRLRASLDEVLRRNGALAGRPQPR